jgi:hypothetical protein
MISNIDVFSQHMWKAYDTIHSHFPGIVISISLFLLSYCANVRSKCSFMQKIEIQTWKESSASSCHKVGKMWATCTN